MPNRPETNTAIQKALSVLELICKAGRPLAVADMADELQLPRQTVHRTVQQLELLNLVGKDAQRERFTVGPRLRSLAIDAISATDTAPTRAILQQLVAEVNETCNVGMLDGHEIIYIDRVECHWPLRMQLKVGSRVPVHCTAIGKLMLAHQNAEGRRRILADADLRRYTKYTITETGVLEAQLDQIAAQGYSINNQEDAIGLIAMAVPIRNRGGAVIAGLGVHAPEPRFPIRHALENLVVFQEAAERLGKALWSSD